MASVLDSLSDEMKKRITKTDQPETTSPMLAKLTHDHFEDENWFYERKFDGERIVTLKKGKHDVRMITRNNKNANITYPELADAFENKVKANDFIVDGEVVAFSDNVTSFERLQGRMQIKDADEARKSNIAVYYYLFDLLYVDGHDVTDLPLTERKTLLKNLIDFEDPIRYTPHRVHHGLEYYNEACKKGWEGLIVKKADSTYVHSRSSNWLKFKCVNQQEFVIGGFTDPQGERKGFGALLLGYYDNGDLMYAGQVGTGFDDETLEDLHDRMQSIERKTTPYDDGDPPTGKDNIHWVTPKLVCEVGFTEWTRDNRLRHPRYLGLRRDKSASKVVKEA